MLDYMRDKVTGKFTFKIPPAWEDELEKIAEENQRIRSDAARLLLRRAMDLYWQDKKLYIKSTKDDGKKRAT